MLAAQVTIGDKIITYRFFLFWGIIFGNYYRKLYSIKFLGEFSNVMSGLVLFFLGNHESFGYSSSFSLGAVCALITVMQPGFTGGSNLVRLQYVIIVSPMVVHCLYQGGAGSVAVCAWHGSSGCGFQFRRFQCRKVSFVLDTVLTARCGSIFGS